jgi:hypothetical protein
MLHAVLQAVKCDGELNEGEKKRIVETLGESCSRASVSSLFSRAIILAEYGSCTFRPRALIAEKPPIV